MARSAKYIRLLYELLFSVYCALLVVAEESMKESSIFLGRLAYPLLFLYQPLAGLLHWTHLSPAVYSDNLALLRSMCWLLAVIIFVCLRILGRLSLIETSLRYVTGFVTVAGYPLIWMNLGNRTGRSLATARWLLFEVVIIAACVVLYLYRRWLTNVGLSILVLALHFGLWAWVAGQYPVVGDGLSLYLLLGICSSLAWGFYVRLSAGFHPPATTPRSPVD